MTGRASRAAALALVLLAVAPVVARGAEEQPRRVFRIADASIDESSGLATSSALPGVVWTVDDSGGGPEVYGLDGRGRTVATVTLAGATNRDWEAVAVGPRRGGSSSWLWVGDIGDNLGAWPSIQVYRVAEPTSRGTRSVGWTAFDLVYPDGPRDAEALLVDPADGRLYIVSKRVQGAAVYRAPARLRTGRTNRLTRVAHAPPLVTDGSFAPDGRVALRDYLQAWLSPDVADERERVSLPVLPQGESLTWTADGTALLVGSEGEHSAVWRVPVVVAGPSVSASPTPSGASVPPTPPAATTDDPPVSPWLVVTAGLAVGAGAALVLALVRRRAERPRPASGPPDHG